MDNSDQWKGFLSDAEDFFFTYLVMSDFSFRCNDLFLIGHSVELYLKAIRIKQTGDVEGTIKKGHSVRTLFELCQNHYSNPFMPDFKLKGKYIDLYNIQSELFTGKSADNEELANNMHFVEYQEFYLIADHLADLKYFNSKWKTITNWGKRGKCIVSMLPNPFWINFAKEAENYLDNDIARIKARFSRFEIGDNLRPHTKAFLSDMYKQP
jgi:hypothetical protein